MLDPSKLGYRAQLFKFKNNKTISKYKNDLYDYRKLHKKTM
jgi:hypothetical protein